MSGETVTVTLTAEEFRLVRLAVSWAAADHDRDARRNWESGDETLARISERNCETVRALWIALGERATA